MGNFCCPPSNPCDHTVEEKKELLSQSDSKASNKAEEIEGVSPTEVVEESCKNEEKQTGLNAEMVTNQSVQGVEAQSSYMSVISILHTDTSRAAQASQSSSEKTETKKDAQTEETQTTLPNVTNASIEIIITGEVEEKEGLITPVLVNVDEADQDRPAEAEKMPLEAAEGNIQKEATEVEKEEVVPQVEVEKKPTQINTESRTTEVDVENKTVEVDIKNKSSELDIKNKTAVVDIKNTDVQVDIKSKTAEVDIKNTDVQVDIKSKTAEVDIKNTDVQVDIKNKTAEVDIKNTDVQVDIKNKTAEVDIKNTDVQVDIKNRTAEVDKEQEPAEIGVEKNAIGENVEVKPTEVGVKEKLAEMDVKEKPAEVNVKEKPAEVDVKEKPAEVDVKEKPAEVDVENTPSEEDIKNKTTKVDTDNKTTEVDTDQKPAELDLQEKPKTSVDALIEKDIPEIKQLAQNDATTAKHEVEDLLTSSDIALNNKKVDTSVTENFREPETSLPETTNELDVVKTPMSVKVLTEEPVGEAVHEVKDKHEKDTASNKPEVKNESIPSAAQDHSEQLSSPAKEVSNEGTLHNIENGQVDSLKDENLSNVDAAFESEKPQETELTQKTCEESSHIQSEAQQPETSANINSTLDEMDNSRDTASDQEKTSESIDLEQKSAEFLLNGLDSSSPVEKSESTEAHVDHVQLENTAPTGPSEAVLLDEHIQEEKEQEHFPPKTENVETIRDVQKTIEKEDLETSKAQTGEIILSRSPAVQVALIPVSEGILEEEQPEDEDIYRGVEEIEKDLPKEKQSKPLLEFTIPGVSERCSLAAAVDILAYSESEWKGNTAKSTLIRKGYSEMSCSFSSLRRVRGDNYCALRATLYQVLATTTQTPAWLLEEDFISLPERLEAQEHLIGGWMFPTECRKAGEKEEAVEKLKHYLTLLQQKWQAAAESQSPEARQRVCDCMFQGEEEEYGLLEVLKFLMLAKAVELHGKMQAGEEVPVFCWLLFARDTSENPQTLLNNHLSQVGFSGGLEQVEMFLLGYALQHTIQTFRLYKTDTEEFVTHYPDDHKQDWPCVCIVTEDDRHYNVPVRKQAQHQLNHDLSVLLPNLS